MAFRSVLLEMVYLHLPSQYIFICHRSISSSAIAVYLHLPSQYIFIRHRSISSKVGATSCRQEMPFSSAPVILSVLRDGEQDDRYRKSDKNRHRQPAGFIPHDPGFIPPHSFHTRPLEPFLCFSSLYLILDLSSISPLYLSGEPLFTDSDNHYNFIRLTLIVNIRFLYLNI